MNSDLLNILGHIEREKGIDKEILIKAVESSLVSAARKSTEPIATRKHISVQIDRETGEIKAFAELTVVSNKQKPTPDEISMDEAKKIQKKVKEGDVLSVEVTPKDFGRIAAQTAKQVIIQKIREAERDLVFNEFKERIGDITMGVVRQKERNGNIIIDLGRAEAVLPQREQSPIEHYNIGNKIRAYVVDVKTTPKGPEIVLSRTHVGLVKRLFELEVPEIEEGIVEIKNLVREAGFRTKVAVASKDPKVDPVGSCVGMRGIRVKNIVRELEPEKLDIVKWEEEITAYVTNALNPATLEKVTVNKEQKNLEVLVAEDQLSVAIGKRGQNVRLASKLTGWNIDIRKVGEQSSEKDVARKEPSVSKAEKTEKEENAQIDSIAAGLDISVSRATALVKGGFSSIEDIVNAEIEKLAKVKGLGKKTVSKLKEKAQEAKQKPIKDETTEEATKKQILKDGELSPPSATRAAKGPKPENVKTEEQKDKKAEETEPEKDIARKEKAQEDAPAEQAQEDTPTKESKQDTPTEEIQKDTPIERAVTSPDTSEEPESKI